jgi:hypothetical protein
MQMASVDIKEGMQGKWHARKEHDVYHPQDHNVVV